MSQTKVIPFHSTLRFGSGNIFSISTNRNEIKTTNWSNYILSRKLIPLYHQIFFKTRNKYTSSDSFVPVLKISRSYRKILRNFHQSNGHLIEDDEIKSFKDAELLWALSEIFLLTDDNRTIVFELVDIARTFFMPNEDDPDYFFKLLVLGLIDEASDFFKNNPQYIVEDDATYEKILDMFTFAISPDSKNPLQKDFQSWKKQVQEFIFTTESSGKIKTTSKLKDILGIFYGNMDSIVKYCDHWLGALIAYTFYVDPMASPRMLRKKMTEFKSKVNRSVDSDGIEKCISSIIGQDKHLIISNIADLGNWLFTAHFVDVFSFANYYDEDQREYYILEYVMTLISSKIPISIIITYLKTCNKQGIHYIELLLSKQHFETEKEGIKLLNLCLQCGFKKESYIYRKIKNVMFIKKYHNGHIASAISYSEGKQSRKLILNFLEGKIFTKLIENVTENDVNDIVTILNSSSTLNTPESMFLLCYKNALIQYLRKNYQMVLVNLVDSMDSEFAPKKFWMILIYICVVVLKELNQNDISTKSDYIFKLMECLETIVLENESNEAIDVFHDYLKLKNKKDIKIDEEIQKIREVLTHSLASSFLEGK